MADAHHTRAPLDERDRQRMKGLDTLALALDRQKRLRALGPIWGLLQEFDSLESWLEPNEYPAVELANALLVEEDCALNDRAARTPPIADQDLVEAVAGLAVWEYRADSRGLERWHPLIQPFETWSEGNMRRIVVWRRHAIDIDADYRSQVRAIVQSALSSNGSVQGTP